MRKRPWIIAICFVVAALWGCSVLQYHRGQVLGSLRGAGVKPHTIKLPVGTMRYLSGGDGYPIIFVHGFGAS